MGQIDQNLSLLYYREQRYDEAAASANDAAGRYRELASDVKEAPQYEFRLAQALATVGQSLAGGGKFEKARAPFNESIDLLTRLVAGNPARLEYRSELSASQNDYALALIGMRHLSDAESLLRAAIDGQRAVVSASPETAIYRTFLNNHLSALADVLRDLGRRNEAAEVAAERLDLWRGAGSRQPR